MSPASGDEGRRFIATKAFNGFHSINVPSEWGQTDSARGSLFSELIVSIQLMSPASGDILNNL